MTSGLRPAGGRGDGLYAILTDFGSILTASRTSPPRWSTAASPPAVKGDFGA